MWNPTHVQVVVQRASGLRIKGKDGTNNCYVRIGLSKTKYQTSVKERAGPEVEWHEECELPIPDKGNTAEIVLTVYHQNSLGLDSFLGKVTIPLQGQDVYERPRNKWFPLENKTGHVVEDRKRGKLEAKIGFIVKSGSLTDLDKKGKHKSSLQSLGASLLSLGGSGGSEKRKSIKSLTKLIGKKKKDKDKERRSSRLSIDSDLPEENGRGSSLHIGPNADPGVGSDDEFALDELSQKGSSSGSLNVIHQRTPLPESKLTLGNRFTASSTSLNSSTGVVDTKSPPLPRDEWESKLIRANNNEQVAKLTAALETRREFNPPKITVTQEVDERKAATTPNKMMRKFKEFVSVDENSPKKSPTKPDLTNIPNELLNRFDGKSREEIILNVCKLEKDLVQQRKKMQEMEDYLDDLLLRVMETTPGILQNPFKYTRRHHK